MKRLSTFAVAILLAVNLCSCNAFISPDWYEDEIADHVKYYIALADYGIEKSTFWEGPDWDKLNSMHEYFTTLCVRNDLSYREVLSGRLTYYSKEANRILKHYDDLSISLTDYKPSSTRENYKSWIFKELHTGIEFVFEISDLDTDTPTLLCEPIESSFEKYIENHL